MFQKLESLGPDAIALVVDRLENRGKDKRFIDMRNSYLNKLNLTNSPKILEIGTGTGIISRDIAARKEFNGSIIAVDNNASFVGKAMEFAKSESVDGSIEFKVDDALNLNEENNTFDIVLFHTVLMHVEDPIKALCEAKRVLKDDGIIVTCDMDIPSYAFELGGGDKQKQLLNKVFSFMVANPSISRELPRMQKQLNLKIVDYTADIIAEIGHADFFQCMCTLFFPAAMENGTISQNECLESRELLQKANDENVFFGAMVLYSYFLKQSDE